MALTVPQSPAREIIEYGKPGCKQSVQQWTQRVLSRSKDIPTGNLGLKFQWGNSKGTAVLFDAIMCNLWYANHLLKDAMCDTASVAQAKEAVAQYGYILNELWPKWTHRPAGAQLDARTTERYTQGMYFLARANEFDQLHQVAKTKGYSKI